MGLQFVDIFVYYCCYLLGAENAVKKFYSNISYKQYERLYAELITSKWNLYPAQCQHALIFLLNMAKKRNNLNVAGILPLNMNTYIVVSNVNSLFIKEIVTIKNYLMKLSSFFSC